MITAHMMIKNEEQWIWFAIQSILPSVIKIFIYDTGSTDKTKQIIQSISSPKIELKEKVVTDRGQLTQLRNQMVSETETDWFLLVDGDEIWPGPALTKMSSAIHNASVSTLGIVVRTRNCVGDIWHYQPESAGKYELLGRKGHLTIRAYRKVDGFMWNGIYPNEAYCDAKGNKINELDDKLKFVDVAYWHVTHLKRTSNPDDVIDRTKKRKIEKGIKAHDKELPEVFFEDRPHFVPSPWFEPSKFERTAAVVLTPLRELKRRFKK